MRYAGVHWSRDAGLAVIIVMLASSYQDCFAEFAIYVVRILCWRRLATDTRPPHAKGQPGVHPNKRICACIDLDDLRYNDLWGGVLIGVAG